MSNRIYPPKICEHCGEEYIPHDKRQKYCTIQHKIDFNNDKRDNKKEELTLMNSRLLKNQSILKNLFDNWSDPEPVLIEIRFLQLLGFDFNTNSSIHINNNTGEKIHWSLILGIEKNKDDNNLLIIHKKDK